MRIVFLPEGGFNSTGAFAELAEVGEVNEKTELYERQGFINPTIRCLNVKLNQRFEVSKRQLETNGNHGLQEGGGKYERPERRWIMAQGHIEPSRWGSFQLSFLGRERRHDVIDVSVHDGGDAEHLFMSGIPEDTDPLDGSRDEAFFLEAHIKRESFNKLVSELSLNGAELFIDLRLVAFPRFYATWSPSIDEGRVIKFLDRKEDVENASDIPEDFWNTALHEELISDQDRPPVTFHVRRPLQVKQASRAISNEVDAEGAIEANSDLAAELNDQPELAHILPSTIASLALVLKRSSQRIFWGLLLVAFAIMLVGIGSR